MYSVAILIKVCWVDKVKISAYSGNKPASTLSIAKSTSEAVMTIYFCDAKASILSDTSALLDLQESI